MMPRAAAATEYWTLQVASTADVDAIMTWFATRQDIEIWGGPEFRYPFTRQSFRKDIRWNRIRSYSLFDPGGELTAFGQLYVRAGRVHLARLVVRPQRRGQGIGKRLIRRLMATGKAVYGSSDYSLFVFRDNGPALQCYRSMGFVIAAYPDDMPHADVCWFLTRRVVAEES